MVGLVSCVLLVVVTASAQEKSPPPASAPAVPTGRTTFHRTGEEIRAEEQKLSPELRKLRREFRLASLLTPESAKKARMAELAKSIGESLAGAPVKETSEWHRLQQDAFLSCGDMPAALAALERRYAILVKSGDRDSVATQAMGEAEFALAKKQYAIAHACYQHAGTAANPELRSRAKIERARVHSAETGSEAAISYLHEVIDQARAAADRDLAHAAQFAVASAYYREKQYERARVLLLEIEAAAEGTPDAEKAKKQRENWERGRFEE